MYVYIHICTNVIHVACTCTYKSASVDACLGFNVPTYHILAQPWICTYITCTYKEMNGLPFPNESCAHHPSHHACQRSSPQWHHLVSTKMSKKKSKNRVESQFRWEVLDWEKADPKNLQNISFHRYFKPTHLFSIRILLLYSLASLHKNPQPQPLL